MLRELLTALRIFFLLTIITGIFYPMLVTLAGQALFPVQAGGSLIAQGERIIGSKLLAQEFAGGQYFHPRPSAGGYQAVPSSASNLAPSSPKLREAMRGYRARYGPDAPIEMITTSASGLDPHISPKTAFWQLPRIALSRGLTPEGIRALERLLIKRVERPTFGIFGAPRVNVLELNLLLDREFLHDH